jgi:alpha-tubulin suppressor-like RCC1 family protein
VPGATGSVTTATPIVPNVKVAMVGSMNICAIAPSGSVSCWGSGDAGDGSPGARDYPTTVAGITDAQTGDTGYNLTCVVRADGTVSCWGGNDSGQIGDGTTTDRLAPTPVRSLSGAVAVATSNSGQFACALKGDGTVWCWGANDVGQLGVGSVGGIVTSPTLVSGLSNIVRVSAGSAHACAIDCYGQLFCWGYNVDNRVGDGTPTLRSTPGLISIGGAVTQVSAGGESTCAVRADGQLWCWGANEYGQLATGDILDPYKPAQVTGITDVAQVAVSAYRACASTNAGAVACWGTAAGGASLGDGTTSSRFWPTPVIGVP